MLNFKKNFKNYISAMINIIVHKKLKNKIEKNDLFQFRKAADITDLLDFYFFRL